MAKSRTLVTITTNILDSIRRALPKNTHDLVLGLATDIEEEYRKNAPRDTGSMAESAYTKMSDGAYQHGNKTTDSAVASQAMMLNPDAKTTPLATPTEKNVDYVAPIVDHFIYNEYGTTRMAARPTLQQSRNRVRNNLSTKHRDLLNRVVTNGHR